jgi:cystathionine beta-lyase/cystathionine gamma-synthase
VKFGTKILHAINTTCPQTGAIINPIYQTTTYVHEEPGVHKGYEYSRADNPTRTILEQTIAALESAKYGLTFASGLAAIDTIITLLQAGDHVLCSDDVYAGTFRLFERIKTKGNLSFSWIDMTNPTTIENEVRDTTKIIWCESPTNPLLKLVDIQTVATIAKKYNCLLVVDNTFMSPYFQQPLLLGADITVHSTTKYLNGHSDVIGGALATNNKELYDQLKFLQCAIGAIPSPFDCWLVLRGIKTLHLRMEQHAKSALALATFLEKHPKIRRVIYPGLKSHPQHELAKQQMSGFGGMISFEIDTDGEGSKRFLKELKLFSLAASLGCVESLIELPALMTHASLPAQERAKLGITDGLVRLSVGTEDCDDLIADLQQALEVVTQKPRISPGRLHEKSLR